MGDDLHTYTGSADRRADPRIDETGIDETETMPVHFRRSALEAGLKPEIRVGDAEGGDTPIGSLLRYREIHPVWGVGA